MSDTRRFGSGQLFPTDTPVPPDRMIGRVDDVDRVATGLVDGRNLILAGPRRTGKTSVADAAVQACAVDGCATVSVDLFRHADAADLARELALSALDNRPVLRRAIAAAGRNLTRLREALGATATLRAREDLGDAVEIALSLSSTKAPAEQRLAAAFELLEPIGQRCGRLVLFLDEFQDIATGRFGDPDTVSRQIRAILQRSPHVSTLFAGSVEHIMRDLFAPSERALSQFGALHELAPITVPQWQAGLRTRLAEDGCAITDTALDTLIDLGCLHPRATMLIAQQTHATSVELLERDVDDALVVEGHRRALRADTLKHQQTLEKIRSLGRGSGRGTYQMIAQRVARGETLYAGYAPQTASRALDALRDAGITEHRGGAWTIIDPLLRRYLAEL